MGSIVIDRTSRRAWRNSSLKVSGLKSMGKPGTIVLPDEFELDGSTLELCSGGGAQDGSGAQTKDSEEAPHGVLVPSVGTLRALGDSRVDLPMEARSVVSTLEARESTIRLRCKDGVNIVSAAVDSGAISVVVRQEELPSDLIVTVGDVKIGPSGTVSLEYWGNPNVLVLTGSESIGEGKLALSGKDGEGEFRISARNSDNIDRVLLHSKPVPAANVVEYPYRSESEVV